MLIDWEKMKLWSDHLSIFEYAIYVKQAKTTEQQQQL